MTGKSKQEKQMKLKSFVQGRPVQLTFFELKGEDDQKYSHLIELWDAIPRYHYGAPERLGRFLDPLERIFEHRKHAYKAYILPAKIQQSDGTWIDQYPSGREELVEDALRKLACEGQGTFLQDERGVELASVFFSLYQLQQELKDRGHTYSINELKESILICNSATIRLESASGKAIASSAIFPDVYLVTQGDLKSEGKTSRCFVRFNPLVTHSINERTYRRFNYEMVMSYRRSLSRWFHKRISSCFVQAEESSVYTIKLSTILRDSGTKTYARLKDNIREVNKALDEMKERDVLMTYETMPLYDEARTNRIQDAKFSLKVSASFALEMLQANKHHKTIRNLTSTAQSSSALPLLQASTRS